jgi:NAD(P)-dependent dehydrogenase (short-subunit alcohol dehydrogenase family)
MHMGINYFGHFYLTYLLWDALKKAGNPRIINVSSIGYRFDGRSYEIDF